ncbi:MAG: zinc-dependent metalloprotease, partial [Cytophagaceae bacterium]
MHVIHLGEALGTGSNISDAQILGAIQGINDKYKNVNGTGVDMQINFCLATRDPNGNPTTGINRVDGNVVSSYSTQGMFALQGVSPAGCTNNNNAVKDLSKWPAANYLNLWIVAKYCLSAGIDLYGQASGQTGSPYDGVTMLYSQFTQSSITFAHEVGHMFLLNHTFQGDAGGSTCPVDTSCANNGDLVCDTPPHRTNDYGATNPCSASGVWDNSRFNFMGYGWAVQAATFNETNCRFTQGQKDRARAAINSLSNINYINSNGCNTPSANDAGVLRFIYPVKVTYTSNCSFPNSLSPVVQLKNFGSSTLTAVTIHYKADNGTLNTYAWTGSLLKDSIVNVALPSLSLNQGAHTLLAYSTAPNNLSDGFGANDSSDVAMTYTLKQTSALSLTTSSTDPGCAGNDGSANVTAVSSSNSFQIKEDFEGTTDWTLMNGSEVNHWVIGSATSNGGNKSLYVTTDGVSYNYNISAISSVHLYKDFFFPANATNIKIKFDWKCDGEGGGFSGVDRLRVYMISTSQIPQPGYQLGIAPQYTASSIGSYYSQSSFKTDSIIGLDANAGSARRLVFNWRNNTALGTQSPAAVDNIIISYDLPAISSYSYAWNSIPSQNTAAASALSAGNYNVVVTDANNCSNNTSVLLTQNCTTGINSSATSGAFRVYPNPATENFMVTCENMDNGMYSIELKNVLGQTVLSDAVEIRNNTLQKSVPVSSLPNGIYTLILDSGAGKTI